MEIKLTNMIQLFEYIPGLVIKKYNNVSPSTVIGFVYKPILEKSISVLHFITENNFTVPVNKCDIYLNHLSNTNYYEQELKLFLGIDDDYVLSYSFTDGKHILLFNRNFESGVKIISFSNDFSIRSDFNVSDFSIKSFFHQRQIDIYQLCNYFKNLKYYE